MNVLIKYIAIVWFLMLGLALYSQTKEELTQQKQKNLKEIKYLNSLLSKTKDTKHTSINQLSILKRKISLRANNIYITKRQIDALEETIDENAAIVKHMEEELAMLKEEYAQMLVYAYKNRNSYNRLLFIFSSSDFNEAYKRLKYIQEYSNYRQKQAELIVKTKADLEKKIEGLEEKKKQKLTLLETQKIEQQKLSNDKKQKDDIVKQLEQKEKELLQQIREKERIAKKLQAEIERIIQAEIEAQRKKNKDKTYELTPEEKELSANFAQNKGKLPWPLARGVISGTFGEHAHPVLPGIKVKNNGIDFQTSQGEKARAVFNGTVTAIIIIPGSNKTVMVKHGNYYTIYQNLIEVFVQKGDKVNTKQNIGIVYTDKDKKNTELHFEIWEGKSPQNPKYWLAKKK